MKHSYWEQFKQTGQIEDYLNYKGIAAFDMAGDNSEGGHDFESEHSSNRDDPGSSSYWRVR